MGVGGWCCETRKMSRSTKSVLLNNLPAQIMVIGQAGGIEVTNWETGITTNLITQNFTNTSNIIQGNTSTPAGIQGQLPGQVRTGRSSRVR